MKQLFSAHGAVGAVALLALALFTPRSAFAQGQDGWRVDVAPLYFWAATTDGNLAINGNRNVPVYMDFGDANSASSHGSDWRPDTAPSASIPATSRRAGTRS